MNEKKTKRNIHCVLFLLSVILFFPVKAYASEKPYVVHSVSSKIKNMKIKTIHESDEQNIRTALDTYGKVKLAKGETFNITKLYLKDGDYINATGATIISSGCIMLHELTETNYKSLRNVTIKGGKWRSSLKDGHERTSFHFTHAGNIKLINMDVKVTNYEGHTFEFVACENVVIKNCKIMPCGKPGTTSGEEQIQLDIATGKTYPLLSGTKFENGACCRNITISNCTVKGNRAICGNYAKGTEFCDQMHSDITITGCTLIGECSEALALFNTYSATVKDNTIITKAPLSRDSYSIGCHFHFFGNNKAASKGSIIVSDNIIKGGRQALQFWAHSDTKFGTVTVTGNKLYCRNGKSKALLAGCITKQNISDNKEYDWDGE